MSDEKDLKKLIRLQEETLKAQKAGNRTKSLLYYIITLNHLFANIEQTDCRILRAINDLHHHIGHLRKLK